MHKEEYCIMPSNNMYSTTRLYGTERHEVFEGRTGNRKKSIEDGLVIFISPKLHRTDKNKSIHLAPNQWLWLKELGEKTWCDYYGKTKEEFRERYGRNYL